MKTQKQLAVKTDLSAGCDPGAMMYVKNHLNHVKQRLDAGDGEGALSEWNQAKSKLYKHDCEIKLVVE